jgi:hypothetical protein
VQRKNCIKALAHDLPKRCHTAVNRLLSITGNDIEKAVQKAPKVIEGILNCYSGQHDKCKSQKYAGLTCKGTKKSNWMITSHYMREQHIEKLTMTADDKTMLTDLIKYRLGEKNLRANINKTTQGVESRNCGLRTSLPKNKRHPRNVGNRFASAIHRMNNGPLDSSKSKTDAVGCPITQSKLCLDVMKEQQRRHDYNIEYQKRPAVTRRAEKIKGKKLGDYFTKNKFGENLHEYRKHRYSNVVEGLRKKAPINYRQGIRFVNTRQRRMLLAVSAACSANRQEDHNEELRRLRKNKLKKALLTLQTNKQGRFRDHTYTEPYKKDIKKLLK